MIWIILWIALGVVGYFMMRQGFLVEFEEKGVGKNVVWPWFMVLLGISSIALGPIFITMALEVQGRNCFRKRGVK